MEEKTRYIVLSNVRETKKNTDRGKEGKMLKKCKKCLDLLEISSNFYKGKGYKDGFWNICKRCSAKPKVTYPDTMECGICMNTVEYDKFSVKTNRCDVCYSLLRKEKKSNSTKSREIREVNYIIPDFKTCIECKIEKEIDLFPIRKSSKDFHRNQCLECYKTKIYDMKRIYKQKNKEVLRKKDIEYRKNRMVVDPFYRAKIDARNVIRKAISKRGYSKNSKTEQILGCSFIDFKEHIESQFLLGMNWDNRDQWHIDHIIPVSFAKNEEELLKLNHYSNLRPLWVDDNQKKSDEIEIETDIYHEILEMRNH